MVDADDERSGPDHSSGPPPFDSMANLRALGDIQRRGLEAANLVVTRVISQAERSGPIFGAEPPPRPSGDLGGSPTDDSAGPEGALSDLFGQYTALTSSLLGAILGGRTSPGASNDSRRTNGTASGSAVTAEPHAGISDGSPETLTLSSTAPGGRAVGELWLHNRSGSATSDVRLHSGDLRRHDGCAITATTVRFDPEHLPELPDLTSRGVRVSVDVPADTPPGRFRGIVLAANLPDLWLVVELEVLRVVDDTATGPSANGSDPT